MLIKLSARLLWIFLCFFLFAFLFVSLDMCGFMAMKNLFPSKESHWQISVQVTKSASKIRLSFVYVHAPSGSDLRIKIMATS